MHDLIGKLFLRAAMILALVTPAQAGDKIAITLKYSDGKTITLSVEADERVAEVKEKASEQDKVPAEKHRLIFHGAKLDDEKTLADYDIKDGAELHVLFRL